MPDKEGAEEKTTKSVVSKRQKQMMGEEGYDVARDMGRVRPSKDKKDATSYPPSDEVKKTQKVNKGPSALERVKADIRKRGEKIMDVKKEELDLTKVAEAFGGFIVEKKEKKEPTIRDLMKQQGVPEKGVNPYVQPSLMDMDKTPVGTKNTPVSNRRKRGRPTGSTKETKTSSPFQQLSLNTNTNTPKVTSSAGAKIEFPSGSPEMGGESKKFAGRKRLKDVPDDPRLRDIEGDSQTKNIKKDIEKLTGQKTREYTQKDKNVTRGNELNQSPIEKKGTRTANLTGGKTGRRPEITGNVEPEPKKIKKPIRDRNRVLQKVRVAARSAKRPVQRLAKPLGKLAARNPFAAAIVGTDLLDRAGRAIPKPSLPKMDVGVVGRRTAG